MRREAERRDAMNKAAASAAVPAGKAGAGTLTSVRELEGAPTCIVIVEGRRHTGLCLHGAVIVLGAEPCVARGGGRGRCSRH